MTEEQAMKTTAAILLHRTGQTTKSTSAYKKFQEEYQMDKSKVLKMRNASFTTRGPPRWRQGNQWPPIAHSTTTESQGISEEQQNGQNLGIKRKLFIDWNSKARAMRGRSVSSEQYTSHFPYDDMENQAPTSREPDEQSQQEEPSISEVLADQTMTLADTVSMQQSTDNLEANANPQTIIDNEDPDNMAKSVVEQLIILKPRSACPQSNGPAGTALGAPSAVKPLKCVTRRGGNSIGGGGGGVDGGGNDEEDPVGCDHSAAGVGPAEARCFKPFSPCVGQVKKAGGGGGGQGDICAEEESKPSSLIATATAVAAAVDDSQLHHFLGKRQNLGDNLHKEPGVGGGVFQEEEQMLTKSITFQRYTTLAQGGFFDREQMYSKPPNNIIVLRSAYETKCILQDQLSLTQGRNLGPAVDDEELPDNAEQHTRVGDQGLGGGLVHEEEGGKLWGSEHRISASRPAPSNPGAEDSTLGQHRHESPDEAEISWKACKAEEIRKFFDRAVARSAIKKHSINSKGKMSENLVQNRDTTKTNIANFFARFQTKKMQDNNFKRIRIVKKTNLKLLNEISKRIITKGSDQKHYEVNLKQFHSIEDSQSVTAQSTTHSQLEESNLPKTTDDEQEHYGSPFPQQVEQFSETRDDDEDDEEITEPHEESVGTEGMIESPGTEVRPDEKPEIDPRYVSCPWITDRGICGEKKPTSHMQLWYGDGYRNLHCVKCKKMSRSNHWKCSHGMSWHKCPEHRIDPDEHQTNRRSNGSGGGKEASTLQLLSSGRPEPQPKKTRTSRVGKVASIKRVIQSINPSELFNLDWAKMPRLALKFPHLHKKGINDDDVQPEQIRSVNNESTGHAGKSVRETASAWDACSGPPRVVEGVSMTKRRFKYPNRSTNACPLSDAASIQPTTGEQSSVAPKAYPRAAHTGVALGEMASCPSGVQFFTSAATGAVCVNAGSSSPVRQGESERSHCREGDLRSDL